MTEGQEQRFTLTAPPPARALGIAAVAALVGAGLMVLSSVLDLGPVVLGIGLVGLLLALALAVAALVLGARARTTVDLDAEGLTLSRAGQRRRVPWAEIQTVTLTGSRLLLVHKEGPAASVAVLNPRTPSDPTFTALLHAIRRRMDADRGYRTG